ncbi:MAG TPA: hypothetical protein VJC39_02215 [Candidatus Nanoarchaeia archaeon]|nr:hypothetical protein [Candidatus Nanoarchaeia archaeon]
MQIINNYIGIRPFTVLVDDSTSLKQLAQEAKKLRYLPFPLKLEEVKKLTLGAMVNAYEQMLVWGKKMESMVQLTEAFKNPEEFEMADHQHQKYKDIVFQGHSLSYALEQQSGCCRYQGALFFVLGYEADLGDSHLIQAAPVRAGVNTVFNEVVSGGQSHKVSIFTDSLQNPSLNYLRHNPRIFEQALEIRPMWDFYSYHHTSDGLVIIKNRYKQVREWDK